MKTNWIIRRLSSDGWDLALRNTRLFWKGPSTRETVTKFLSNHKNYFLSAEVENIPVGQLLGYLLDHWDGTGPMLFLYTIDVVEQHRRKGIARALITEFKKIKNEMDCSEIFVLTHESNQAAMQLYASMGGIRVAQDEAMFEFH
jgi:ribosomal protein S18 acetylase RimI-like enzyme